MFYAYGVNNKIIILVANSTKYPSNIMIPHIKKTWCKDSPFKVFFYQGESQRAYIEKSHIYLKSPGGYMDMGKKFIECLEIVDSEYKYDYIFKTTTGSYINFTAFEKFIENFPKHNLYCAPLDIYPPTGRNKENQLNFGSGRGVFLSRDVVKKIIKGKSDWHHELYDDVALGKFLTQQKIHLTTGYRQDFKYYPVLKEFNFEDYHYGFRLDTSGIPRVFEIFSIYSIRSKLKYSENKKKRNYFIITIVDLLMNTLLTMIARLNFKFNSSFYKTRLNLFLNNIYKIIKKSPVTYKFFKSLKKKTNIRTAI